MEYPAHYAWLFDFDGPWCTNVNTSAWSESNVTSGTCVYISTSKSIKVNKSGIVCRVFHQTSLQALVFTLVHRGPSAHYAWLVDFDGFRCTNVNRSAWSDVWWYTPHTMPDFLTLMVNKSGIVCRVFHQTSLQALVFTLVHRGPSKSTSQA
jgi:hypothetical protein